MKKRILSILLTLCMVLMLVPATAFAEMPSQPYTVTQNFKYGTLLVAVGGGTHQTSPYTDEVWAGERFGLGTVVNCAPYKFVGWKETGSGTVYADFTYISVLSNRTFDALYEVDGSLAITVDGFEVGNTPADTTLSFASTIPGVTFSEDDISADSGGWEYFDEERSLWWPMSNTEVFEAGTRYRRAINLDNKGLTVAPAVTVNGNTPDDCFLATRNGVPYALVIGCEFGTPPEPVPAITIDGPDVVCAQQDYEFTATPPAGVTLDEKFGQDTGYSGSDIVLTIDENGVGHGVVPAAYYEPAANGFDVNAHGMTANGTPVSTTKHVEVSPEHIYVDGVCGCGAVLTYTVEYIGSAAEPICMEVKTHGEPLTLRGETFKMDGYVQTGWVDKETGAVYDLGDTYTEDADVTLNPYFEKIITLTVPYTTTVALGDVGVPGEKTFTLALIGDSAPDKDKSNVTVSGSVTTNGKGSYNGTLTITGPEETLWYMLSEGAFVQQVDNGEAGWTVDDTVWGVLMEEIPVAYATSDDAVASKYTVYVVPASIDGNGDYYIDWENLQKADMTFTNTYTAHAYELKHDATHHWDECACKDVQNKELHKYGDWKVTKEATETSKGEKEHTCTVCGYTEKAEIAKLAATTDPTKPDTNPDTNPDTKPDTDKKPYTTSPQTRDNSNMALWIALLFVSGAGVIGTTVYGKKKKPSVR